MNSYRLGVSLLAALTLFTVSACSSDPETKKASAPATAPSAPNPDSVRTQLDRAVEKTARKYHAKVGVAISAGNDTIAVGDKGKGPVWSTIKVPIAIAALKDGADKSLVDLAIKESDNDAAYSLWSQVQWHEGSADKAVEELLEDYGSHADIHDTAFGYSTWSLKDQAVFGAELPCIEEADYVHKVLKDIVSWQKIGLSKEERTRAKSGWGLDEDENEYTYRQFGVHEVTGKRVGVALSVVTDGEDYAKAEPAVKYLAHEMVGIVDRGVKKGIIKPAAHCKDS
ncbi:hypothetical protein QP900_01855 [Corynebacterium marquesiae]|uniref:S-adenosylmethionine synthetase n=1 Tax=Corynebacterium marquesiae TaxID=2913503 RepID=A0ABU8P6K9_9CORY|nr:hypothetical protein [Corynebacterium marquesiae]MDK8453809.1 hypothetical protein [Corynebacterium marquesiae]MDK8479847.1 hypothetical protein [Corynebacterium marquesiae]MDK8530852.1 hypothetical protein [Corynebacterium marquesiae]MDK8723926.1 hypothetical protein [Corynebacterium marquesiae]MDK8769495.1 hypothetical protein [Corynebacterium marquesiae]